MQNSLVVIILEKNIVDLNYAWLWKTLSVNGNIFKHAHDWKWKLSRARLACKKDWFCFADDDFSQAVLL